LKIEILHDGINTIQKKKKKKNKMFLLKKKKNVFEKNGFFSILKTKMWTGLE